MKTLKWFVVNAMFAVLAYYALYEELVWAEDLLLFSIWAFTIVAMLMVIAVGSKTAKKRNEERSKGEYPKESIPHWADATYDFALIAVLASQGWTFCAVLWLIQMVCVASVYQTEKEDKKEAENV